MKTLLTLLFVIVLMPFTCVCIGADDTSAIETVRSFYIQYFSYDYRKTPKTPPPEIEFSRAFKADLKINKDLCAKHVGEICGFGADVDPYTDAQDSDDNLDANKAKLTVTQENNGLIKVKFNLFPAEASSFSVVKYKLVRENGKWLVDDIIYSNGKSARVQMKEENEYNLKHPPEILKPQEKRR